MISTRLSLVAAFFALIVVLTGWLGENPTWATSCPQHQGVKDKIGEVNGQAQALPVPPSLEQREQMENQLRGWVKGLVGALILISCLIFGFIQQRRKNNQGSLLPQLCLPYSSSEPILVTPVG